MKDFKVRKSILTRKDCYSLEHGVNAVLKDRFETLNRRNVTAFCRKYGVSENVFFLTAYNLSIGISAGKRTRFPPPSTVEEPTAAGTVWQDRCF